MEPTQADVAAVSNAMGQPTQQPQQQQPEPQQQPAPVTQQPAPTQQQPVQQPTQPQQPADPFSAFTNQPVEPGQPTQPQQQPVEPVQPVQQQPQQVEAPQQQPQQPTNDMTYEQYIESVLKDIPQAPGMPDPSQVDPNSEEGIQQFFTDLMTTAERRFEANYERKMAIQNAERKLWDDAFGKFPSLRDNNELRNMVHSIRMGEFNKGVAITPTQAADRLLKAFGQQYQQGIVDNQVVTTYESVQPTGGGGTTVPTSADTDRALQAVQTGGEEALAQILDAQFQSGQM